MKKLMFSAIAILFAAGTVSAQDMNTPGYPATATTSTDLKASGGEVTLEANVNLLGGNISLNNQLNQIKGRYFLSDGMALRLGVNITLESHTDRDHVPTFANIETKRSHFGISIMPGIEKHFAGTNRLSPYVGAEIGIAIDSRKQETTAPAPIGNSEIKGQWTSGPRGYTQIALNGIAGFDFYVARHLFIGYEIGFGLGIRAASEVEQTRDGRTEVVNPKDSNFFISPLVRNGIRVGFVF